MLGLVCWFDLDFLEDGAELKMLSEIFSPLDETTQYWNCLRDFHYFNLRYFKVLSYLTDTGPDTGGRVLWLFYRTT